MDGSPAESSFSHKIFISQCFKKLSQLNVSCYKFPTGTLIPNQYKRYTYMYIIFSKEAKHLITNTFETTNRKANYLKTRKVSNK